MAEFLGTVVLDGGARGIEADFVQRSDHAPRVAGELYCGGVGEEFPLPGDGGLNQSAEKIPDVAQQHQCQPGPEHDGNPAAVFFATATGTPAVKHDSQQVTA